MPPRNTAATADSSASTGRVAAVTGGSRGNGQVIRANGGLVCTAGSADAGPSTEGGFHP
jgi:hypothetical protein